CLWRLNVAGALSLALCLYLLVPRRHLCAASLQVLLDVRQTGMFSYRAGICNRVIPNVEDLNPIASASDPLEGQRRRMRYQTVPASQPNATEATTASIAPPRTNANPVACCPSIGLIAATIYLKTSNRELARSQQQRSLNTTSARPLCSSVPSVVE